MLGTSSSVRVSFAALAASCAGFMGVPASTSDGGPHNGITQAVQAHIVLLYDNSSSQSGFLFAPTGPDKILFKRVTTLLRDKLVAALARHLPPGMLLRVASFGDRVVVSPTWVRTAPEIAAAFDAVEQPLGAPSPIWDGVWGTADMFDEIIGRKIVLLITDGRASANVRGFEEAAGRLADRGVIVHSILTVDPRLWARIDTDGDPSASLRALAGRTNGTFLYKNPADVADYAGVLLRSLGW